jgi:hypothetical protein
MVMMIASLRPAAQESAVSMSIRPPYARGSDTVSL